MKIYKDDELAPGKECYICKTRLGVFYNRANDYFLCGKCEYEIDKNDKRKKIEQKFFKNIDLMVKYGYHYIENCDHKSKDVFYYHYKGRVYKVVTTKPFTAGKLESIREGIISGMIETCRANNIDFSEEDYRKKFNEDYKNSDESVVYYLLIVRKRLYVWAIKQV